MQDSFQYVMSIAGFDPSTGAGVLADIKTFEAYRLYGLAVNTANTIQNDNEFISVDWVKPEIIFQQIDILMKRFKIEWVKFGLIENLNCLYDSINLLKKYNPNINLVWDPVIKSTTGFHFHNSIDFSLLTEILKSIYIITPNIPEANILFNKIKDFNEFNNYLLENNYCKVLLKGGHSDNKSANDILFTSKEIIEIKGNKYPNYKKHGTGCIYSSALIGSLANGRDLVSSCRNAKTYVEIFLTSNNSLLGFHQ